MANQYEGRIVITTLDNEIDISKFNKALDKFCSDNNILGINIYDLIELQSKKHLRGRM